MAKVTNQDLPLEDIEDELNPPIPFIDTYRRALSEGISHPKLPIGEEIVTFSKKESRPAQRSDWKYFDKPDSEEWRDIFKECLDCWKSQYDTEAEVNACDNKGSKHYHKPWHYVPGASNTFFLTFMGACLDFKKANPNDPYSYCDDTNPPSGAPLLEIAVDSFIMACGESQGISVDPINTGCPPYTWSLEGGGILSGTEGSSVTYTAPETNPNCSFNPTITVIDRWGKSASVSLAVNCFSDPIDAFKLYDGAFNPGHTPPGCQFSWECSTICFVYNYNYLLGCDNTINGEDFGNYCAWLCSSASYPYPEECVNACVKISAAVHTINEGCPSNCALRPCGDSDDLRTEDQKAAGCCPFNWITGLPF